MKKYVFRNKPLKRTCTKEYKDYHSYRHYLEIDFNHRCAYCNLRDCAITTPFEIDHYIPQAEFNGVWPELLSTYANLVYSCKKCNGAKSNLFEGDLSKKEIVNNLFYDPVKTDYNTIFFRNECGEICSDDEKGQNMITLLRLYRPIHSVAWICEELENVSGKLKQCMEGLDPSSEKYKKLMEARYELMDYLSDYHTRFLANYNNKDW